jgi:hypothetical protein
VWTTFAGEAPLQQDGGSFSIGVSKFSVARLSANTPDTAGFTIPKGLAAAGSPPVTAVGWKQSPYFWMEDAPPTGEVKTMVIPAQTGGDNTPVQIAMTLPPVDARSKEDPFQGFKPSQYDALTGDWAPATLYNPVTACEPEDEVACAFNSGEYNLQVDRCVAYYEDILDTDMCGDSYEKDTTPADNLCCNGHGSDNFYATGRASNANSYTTVCECCPVPRPNCTRMACSSKVTQGDTFSPMEHCEMNNTGVANRGIAACSLCQRWDGASHHMLTLTNVRMIWWY